MNSCAHTRALQTQYVLRACGSVWAYCCREYSHTHLMSIVSIFSRKKLILRNITHTEYPKVWTLDVHIIERAIIVVKCKNNAQQKKKTINGWKNRTKQNATKRPTKLHRATKLTVMCWPAMIYHLLALSSLCRYWAWRYALSTFAYSSTANSFEMLRV